MHIIGDVEGRQCVLVDDIVDSGGALQRRRGAAKEKAALGRGLHHARVLSNGAVKRVHESKLKELVVSNSIDPGARPMQSEKIRTISVAALMGDAIWRIANEQSVSSLFE